MARRNKKIKNKSRRGCKQWEAINEDANSALGTNSMTVVYACDKTVKICILVSFNVNFNIKIQ